MTRAQAAVELRGLLGDGESSALGEALEVAIRALSPTVRKSARPKLSRHVLAFQRVKFPNVAAQERARARYAIEAREGWAEREAAVSPEARAQFEGRVRVAA